MGDSSIEAAIAGPEALSDFMKEFLGDLPAVFGLAPGGQTGAPVAASSEKPQPVATLAQALPRKPFPAFSKINRSAATRRSMRN